jgi:hypothetical protein
MKNFQPWVSQWSRTFHFHLTAERVQLFAQVMGVSLVEGATLDELPTFQTIFREGEFQLLEDMKLELKDVLHGEQEYEWLHSIPVGANLTYRTQLKQVTEKKGKGSNLFFFLFETEVENEGTLHVRCLSTIIFRETVRDEVNHA